MITHSYFAKLDLRIAKIVSVEKVENTVKLYKIMVDIDNPQPLQIISGLAGSYTIEELINKNIIVLTNLELKKIKGLESQGILLAAVDDNKNISLLIPDIRQPADLPPGTKIF